MTQNAAMKEAVLATLAANQKKYSAHEDCRKTYVRLTGNDWFEAGSKKPAAQTVVENYVGFHPPYISPGALFQESKAESFGSWAEFEVVIAEILKENDLMIRVNGSAGLYGDYRDAQPMDIDHSLGRSTGMSNAAWINREIWRERVAEECAVKVISKNQNDLKEFEFEVAEAIVEGYALQQFQTYKSKIAGEDMQMFCAFMIKTTEKSLRK